MQSIAAVSQTFTLYKLFFLYIRLYIGIINIYKTNTNMQQSEIFLFRINQKIKNISVCLYDYIIKIIIMNMCCVVCEYRDIDILGLLLLIFYCP